MPRSVLSLEHAPFLLTALFGVLGWTVSHLVDDVTKAPVIEYSPLSDVVLDSDHLPVYCKPPGAKKAVSIQGYRITNISRDRFFVNLSFLVLPQERTQEFVGVRLVPEPPAYLDSNLAQESCLPKAAKFILPKLLPGWEYRLLIWVPQPMTTSLYFTADAQPVRLLQSSFETYMARHEASILLWLTGLWLALALVYLRFLTPRSVANLNRRKAR